MVATTEWLVPFSFPQIGENEAAAAAACIRDGWLTSGPRVEEFEKGIAEFVGGDTFGVAVNSCSAGLLVALKGLGIGAGDEVITTTNTYTGTPMAIAYAGAEPVLVDVDPDTRNIDPGAIARAVNSRTKAIIPVHIAGLVCDLDAINAIAKKHGLRVIEDAAHALGSTKNGKQVGNDTSDVTVFSFSATKPITTGEGGMLVTNDPKLAGRCRTLSFQGLNRSTLKTLSAGYRPWDYDVVAEGFKFNMTDLSAAIGLEQLLKIEEFRKRRVEIAERYFKAFESLPIKLPKRAAEAEAHAWHLFIVGLKDETVRNNFIDDMATARIQCSVHYVPIHVHSYWGKRLSTRDKHFPVADGLYPRSVSLPLYSALTNMQVDYVVDNVKRLLT